MSATTGYMLTLLAHQIWRYGVQIRQTLKTSIVDRVRYGSPAETVPKNPSLILCNYRWIDGRQYTLVQPRQDTRDAELFCAVAMTKEGKEIDVSEAVASLFGPHLDFHGADLTVRDVLDCIDLQVDHIDCFVL